MNATLLYRERLALVENRFVEMVVWQLKVPAKGSTHLFKYRLALVVDGQCVLRYDNEAGKGDHRHGEDGQRPYRFVDPQRLLEDFWRDVDAWR
jgi:hypothetical protein